MATLIVGDDGSNTLPGTAGADLIYGYDPTNGPQNQASAIMATRVATGLNLPTFAGAPPGDTSRLFIVEKTGQIKILDLASGQILATPFLDLLGQISDSGERGLLGLAFDPDFATNGFIYIDVSVPPVGDTEIRRYHVDPLNPNVVDSTPPTVLLTIPQSEQSNHKGGWVGFGPDGYLYITVGDGGGGFDQLHSGQDINSLRGKILRIDVHSPPDPGLNYHIPADNPFVGADGADEIFAYGLRNPWRASFDRGLGDFFIGDVGQNRFEEVNLGEKGVNYGWNAYEGDQPVLNPPFPSDPVNNAGPLRNPINFYGREVGQSITGGYVYRGEAEALQGQYFFADFVQGKLFTLRFDSGTNTWVRTDRTSQITTDFGEIDGPSSFGEDGRGNLYLVDLDFFNPSGGEVFKLTPVVASADQADVLSGLAGNDMLFGGSGNDALAGGVGADVLLGGPGIDTAHYSSSSAAVNVNLQTGLGAGGDAQGDILGGVENVVGSAFNDMLTGDSGANTLAGGPGADALNGGLGSDTADYSSSSAGVSVNLQTNSGLNGDAQGDTFNSIENLIGSAFSDMLTGDGNANTLTGGAGNDTFTGGLGADTLIGGLAPDMLDGGRGIDTAVFSGLRSAYTINHIGNTLVVTGPDGSDTLTHIEKLTFNDGTVLSGLGPVHSDFSGDSTSDLLWRHDSGQLYFWNMNGLQTNTEGGPAHAPVPNDWHVQGSADFDGDGNSDVLWRHDTGPVYFWEMDGLQVKAEGAPAHAPVPNDWHIQGTGDFNADGNGDILWRHDTGPVYLWEMDGLQVKAEGAIAHAAVPNDWHIQDIGDFDGDTKSDILWRHDSGQVYIWEMEGLNVKTEGAIAHALVPNDWHVQGIGDFDGDGNSDILWRHDTGQVYIWEMNGLNVKMEGTVAHAPVTNDWHIQNIGDFNDDGNSDILWRHDSGQVYIWEMNGLQLKAEGAVAHAAVPNDWHIQL
jgi:glucose/arabinose dehydrogenase